MTSVSLDSKGWVFVLLSILVMLTILSLLAIITALLLTVYWKTPSVKHCWALAEAAHKVMATQ